MPANTNPIFALTPNSIPIANAAANLASDGSGTLPTLVTAGANGTRVDQVNFRNCQLTQAASSAMLCKVFLTDETGANPQLVGEVALAAATRSATAIGANGVVTFSPALIMKSGQLLKVSQSVYAGVQDRLAIYATASDF